MPETDPELAAVLDAEYREFVRSLHKDTIATVSRVDDWWHHEAFRVTVFAETRDEGDRNEEDGEQIEREYRNEIHPALMRLINGHPDPEVRDAADFLAKRLWGAIMIIHRPPPRSETREEENQVAIQLIHNGVTALRRAAYHAPFRVHRPEPDWDGVPVGNAEGLPSEILKRMKERGEHYEG
jgi:hypothetical protein